MANEKLELANKTLIAINVIREHLDNNRRLPSSDDPAFKSRSYEISAGKTLISRLCENTISGDCFPIDIMWTLFEDLEYQAEEARTDEQRDMFIVMRDEVSHIAMMFV